MIIEKKKMLLVLAAVVILLALVFVFSNNKYTSEDFVIDFAAVTPSAVNETVPEFERIAQLQEPSQMISAVYGNVTAQSRQENGYRAQWYSTSSSKLIILTFDSSASAKTSFELLVGTIAGKKQCSKMQYVESFKCTGNTSVYILLKNTSVISLEK